MWRSRSAKLCCRSAISAPRSAAFSPRLRPRSLAQVLRGPRRGRRQPALLVSRMAFRRQRRMLRPALFPAACREAAPMQGTVQRLPDEGRRWAALGVPTGGGWLNLNSQTNSLLQRPPRLRLRLALSFGLRRLGFWLWLHLTLRLGLGRRNSGSSRASSAASPASAASAETPEVDRRAPSCCSGGSRSSR